MCTPASDGLKKKKKGCMHISEYTERAVHPTVLCRLFMDFESVQTSIFIQHLNTVNCYTLLEARQI